MIVCAASLYPHFPCTSTATAKPWLLFLRTSKKRKVLSRVKYSLFRYAKISLKGLNILNENVIQGCGRLVCNIGQTINEYLDR